MVSLFIVRVPFVKSLSGAVRIQHFVFSLLDRRSNGESTGASGEPHSQHDQYGGRVPPPHGYPPEYMQPGSDGENICHVAF